MWSYNTDNDSFSLPTTPAFLTPSTSTTPRQYSKACWASSVNVSLNSTPIGTKAVCISAHVTLCNTNKEWNGSSLIVYQPENKLQLVQISVSELIHKGLYYIDGTGTSIGFSSGMDVWELMFPSAEDVHSFLRVVLLSEYYVYANSNTGISLSQFRGIDIPLLGASMQLDGMLGTGTDILVRQYTLNRLTLDYLMDNSVLGECCTRELHLPISDSNGDTNTGTLGIGIQEILSHRFTGSIRECIIIDTNYLYIATLTFTDSISIGTEQDGIVASMESNVHINEVVEEEKDTTQENKHREKPANSSTLEHKVDRILQLVLGMSNSNSNTNDIATDNQVEKDKSIHSSSDIQSQSQVEPQLKEQLGNTQRKVLELEHKIASLEERLVQKERETSNSVKQDRQFLLSYVYELLDTHFHSQSPAHTSYSPQSILKLIKQAMKVSIKEFPPLS